MSRTARLLRRITSMLCAAATTAFVVGGTTANAQTPAASPASVSGVIADDSGGVLPGVLVSVIDQTSGTARSGVTGGDGRFALSVPPGTYVLRAELAAFAPHTSRPLTLAAGTTETLTITLLIQNYGETVVVTGSRSPEALRVAPVAVSVVGESDIETSPASHVGELLRGVPGLNVIELSARDVQIAARTASGRNARTTLALLDGRTIYQDYFGMVLWDLLPVSFGELKQVEVARGPGSSLWGANAMTGVINLITKSPRESLGTEAHVGFGSIGTREFGALHAGADGRLSYKVSGSFFHQDAWERPSALPDGTPLPPYTNGDTTQYKADARVDFDRNSRVRWRFDAGTASSGGIMLVASGPFDVDPLRQHYGSVAYSNGSTSVTAFLNVHTARYQGLLAPSTTTVDSQSFHVESSDLRTAGTRHLLVYGGSLNLSHFDLSFAPGVHRRTELGAFVSDDFTVSDRVRLAAGGRFDWFDTFGLSFSPRVGVVVEPVRGQSVRATYNRAYVAPSITENFMNFPSSVQIPLPTGFFTVPFLALGDENLERQTLDSFEVGYTGQVSRRTTVNLSAYRSRTQGLINLLVAQLYSPADPPPGWPLPPALLAGIPLPKLFRWSSLGQLDEAGLEAGVDVRATTALSTAASYSLQVRPDLSGPDGSPVPFVVNIPPRHRVNLGVRLHTRRVLGSFDANFTDRAFWSDVLAYQGWTDRFWMLNGSVGVSFAHNRMTWTIRSTNLANRATQQHIFGDIIRRRVTTDVRVKL
jgi:outer membrane receptor protein involved in Fe transport